MVPAALKEVALKLLKRASLSPNVINDFCLVADIFFLGKVLEQVVAMELEADLEETFPTAISIQVQTWFGMGKQPQ